MLRVSAEVLVDVGGPQQSIFDEDRQRSQDEGGKQIHVDVVPHAVQFPGECDQQQWVLFSHSQINCKYNTVLEEELDATFISTVQQLVRLSYHQERKQDTWLCPTGTTAASNLTN